MRGRLARGVAVIAAVAATAAIYVLLIREDSGGTDRGRGDGRTRVPEDVRELLAGLSVEQKVGELMLVGFKGSDSSAPFFERIGSERLGGVLVGSANWIDAAQGTALVGELRAAGAEAGGTAGPLIAVRQEGGEYRSLVDLPPSERELDIGDLGDPGLAEDWARESGDALREAGFDLNLAPVADVATLDSAVADRAFSDDPALVARMTAAAVRGCAEAQIACAARHFPGLGAAAQSTDDGPATVSVDAATLAARDLPPFEAAIEEGVPAVVLSHAFYAAYDPVTPASLSAPIATELLRDQLGFEGVAITDDLGAGAIKAVSAPGPAAVAALAAGADMLLVEAPEDVPKVRSALLAAAGSGAVDPARLDQAAGRVLALKRDLGLIERAP